MDVSYHHDDCLRIYLSTGKYIFQARMLDGSEGAKDESAVLSAGPGGESERERERERGRARVREQASKQAHSAFKKGIQTLQYFKAN